MTADRKHGSLEELVSKGREWDEEGWEKRLALCTEFLQIRNRDGQLVPLDANKAQMQFEQKARRRNIVLKARQMGMTTWIAGRFFLKTITHPGTVTVQVAHTQEAAESLFRMVHRFVDQMPEELRKGELRTSKAT